MAVSPDHDGDSDSDEDCWDVFGDDDDSSDDSTNANETGINGNNRKEEDDDEDVVKACEEGSLYLTKQFLRKNSQITLKQRHVVVGVALFILLVVIMIQAMGLYAMLLS